MLYRARVVLGLVVLALGGSCVSRDSPTGVGERMPAGLVLQPALIPSPADGSALPINRIRVVTARVPDNAVLGDTVVVVQSGDPSCTLDLRTMGLTADNSVLNGPGTITNATGQTLTLRYTTVGSTAALINNGTLVANGTVNVNGALTASASGLIRLQGDGTTGFATLTVAQGFTNNGSIELTSTVSAYGATLAVPLGNTLTNAAGATITSLVGAGGSRTIDTTLDNQGTLIVAPGAAHSLQITGSLVTSGVVNLEIGGLTAATLYDRLAATGAVTLGGTLNIGLINAFVPAIGDTFTVTTYGSRTGSFVTTNLPTLPSGSWSVGTNPTALVLSVIP